MEKTGYLETLDYQMSKIFGLDWKQYDNQRMQEFVNMFIYENERQEKELKK